MLEDPRVIRVAPPAGPEPQLTQPLPAGIRIPKIGETIHFFPHRGHHPESHFGPHAAIVINRHPTEPRMVNLYYFGPKGEVGSYEWIPHRSLTPSVYPLHMWLGHAMPPQSHWEFIDQ